MIFSSMQVNFCSLRNSKSKVFASFGKKKKKWSKCFVFQGPVSCISSQYLSHWILSSEDDTMTFISIVLRRLYRSTILYFKNTTYTT